MLEIPGYDIKEQIGEGGSSQVWLALRKDDNRKTALKILHAKYSSDPAMRKRLLREAQVIGNLNHHNIVKIFKWGLFDQRFYMILEYLANGSLSEYKELSKRDRLKTLIQICDGVAYIHSLGIVHRDLKPSNIMFGNDRIPRLVDFGISLFSQENHTRLTHTNMVMGTLSYMSPEQQTAPGEVDHRTDIYSIGAILYEVFTGKKPVGRFDDPSKLVSGFNPKLENSILTCLAHNPAERYQKVLDLQKNLVELWREGLFEEDSGAEASDERFDSRIGYWIQKVSLGTASERIEARRRIQHNARPDDARKLVEIADASGMEVRAAIIPALGSLKQKGALRFLVKQMTDPQLAREACAAIAELGDPRAVEPLSKVVKKNEVYSYAALVPLALLGDEKHMKLILPYLKSKTFSDRQEAVKAFETRPARKFLRDLKKLYKTETDTDLRNRLYRIIQSLEVM